jgi:dsRNA-specific ribonuclease
MDSEIDKYILYSFKKNFSLNQRDIELFEPTKILGDVLEALIGAVYIDSGGDLEIVLDTFKFILCPFVLYVAKYSKQLNHEPKEDFTLTAWKHKIIPDFRSVQQQVLRLEDFDERGQL